MAEREPTRPLFWVKPEDRKGKLIDPDLVKAAEAIFSRVAYLTGQFLNDEAQAPQILERVVHSVWDKMTQNQSPGQETIVNLEAYLFRSMVRELADIRAKESRLQYGYPTEALGRMGARDKDGWVRQLERELDVETVLSHAEGPTLALYEFWAAGDSWRAVAKQMGIASADKARGLFRYGVRKAWDRLASRGDPRGPKQDEEPER